MGSDNKKEQPLVNNQAKQTVTLAQMGSGSLLSGSCMPCRNQSSISARLRSDFFNQGGTTMLRSIALAATVVLLAACSTTSTVHQPHRAPAGQSYAYSFANQGGDDHAGIARLDNVIQAHLREAGLITAGAAEQKIEVVVKHYYVRSNGARFWAGIMAGRDKIVSNVRVVGGDGTQVGNFDVETFNSTAWGTTDGLMQKHAEELVSRIKGA